ncbi:MAG: 3-isopropylmalate dehydrogenase, partial [Bacteroidota bacterium]
ADILFFRELTGDIYFGEKGRKNDGDTAYDLAEYSKHEVERIASLMLQEQEEKNYAL